MDETNRIGAIVLSLLLIFLALLVILLAWGAPGGSIDRIGDLANYLGDHNYASTKLLITFGALIFVLVGVIVIIVELAPPQTGSVKVAKVGSGEARIGTDEITRQLERELRSAPRLRNVEVHVSSRGPRAIVRLELYVDSEADVTQAADEAIQRVRDIVEGRMGVELDSPPRADVHFSEQAGSKGTTPNAPSTSAPASTPSWRPGDNSPPPQPAPSSNQPVSTGGTIHEASSTAHEDRPAGA